MSETFLYQRNINKTADYNVWLAFPEKYAFALSSIGYLWLFKELDESENIFAERISTDTEKTILNPTKVDAIGFSLSFDMDFINVFKILEKYNIPFKTKDRGKEHPLIFGGGPVLTTNPEPYKDIFDFMIIGDGEEVIKEVVNTCRQNPKWELKNGKWETNSKFYNNLSNIDGIYLPNVNNSENPVKKLTVKLDNCIHTPILSEESYFSNTFIIEISRGCYNCCGFCTASYLNLPTRFVEYEKIIEKIELGLKYTNKIALLGALVSAHPRFEDICSYIYNKIQNGTPIEMSISSMRATTLTPNIVKTLVAAGQKSITIAIEASTERLRKVINKHITEDELLNAIRISQENGLKSMKIYAMLGLPTETQEDIEGFVTLAKKLKQEFKGFNITLSFSTFVPKPQTPFQYVKREDTKSLEKKIAYLQKEFHKIGMASKFSSPKWDYYQTLLSRGDSSLTDYLIEVYNQGGKIGAYKNALKKLSINPEKYLNDLTSFYIKNPTPWNNTNILPGKEKLIKEFNRLITS